MRRRTWQGSTREEDIPWRLCSIIQGQLSNRAVYMPAAPLSISHLHRIRLNSHAVFSEHTLPLHVHQQTNKPVNRLLAFLNSTSALLLLARVTNKVWSGAATAGNCRQPMHPAANGHLGRSHLASSVWPGQLGCTFGKTVLLTHNQDCNTMHILYICVIFLFAAFLFFSTESERIS